jgi:3-oxoacyl-[acyl-carrier protein] reductase
MKRALITGASRGIGQAIAQHYRDAGYQVLTPTRAELDLASHDSIAAFVGSALEVDVLVNNGAENKIAKLDDLELCDWQRIIDINMTAVFLLTRAAAKHMQNAGWGRVVNIGSVYGMLGRPGRGAYSSSKAALIALTRTAALEYGPHGVLVNAVCPGFVETDMTRQNNDAATIRVLAEQTALKRLAAPAEIARLVCFLGSEQNTYLTGQAVVIDGGFSIQ